MKRLSILFVVLMLQPLVALAWWNDDWGYRKEISLDVQKVKQDGLVASEDGLALVRLHSGNFLFFPELAAGGKDIRIIAGDDTTPLKFFIEKADIANEMALIWVKLPKEVVSAPEPSVWLYFNNPEAVDGQDRAGVFNLNEVLNYSFENKDVKDNTANANHPSQTTASINDGGLIGGAATFQGSQYIRVPEKPSLAMQPVTGWSVSLWVKLEQNQSNSVLWQRGGSASQLTLAVKEQTPILEVIDGSAVKHEFAGTAAITPSAWHQLGVSVNADGVSLLLDGNAAGQFPVKIADLTGDMAIGADLSGARGFTGALDQLSIFKVARDANAVKYDFMMQGAGGSLLTYGDEMTADEDSGGDESYLLSTLDNVTVDGWVIIGILVVMSLISWVVMLWKGIVVSRIHSQNRQFEQAFRQLDAGHLTDLEHSQESAGNLQLSDSPALFSLAKGQNAFKASSLYRIYHVGVEEMEKRFVKAVGAEVVAPQTLSGSSMEAVKASMHVVVVRELQKLNSLMVLLTIAIAGGPFLGLLGTVVGVMITFASIAASGEINVNAIAPGIAAALVATVAGLFVAIPALFGYNYLGSKIKVVSADMQVFVDEFVAKLAEEHT